MKTFICVLAVWVAGLAIAESPVSRPASSPSIDVATQRMIHAMQQQIADLKAENQKLRADLAKMRSAAGKPGAPAGKAAAAVTLGMTRDDALATFEANNWYFDPDSSERLVGGKKTVTEVWTNQRPKARGGDFRPAEVGQNFATRKDDAKPGQPEKVIFQDGVVVEVIR